MIIKCWRVPRENFEKQLGISRTGKPLVAKSGLSLDDASASAARNRHQPRATHTGRTSSEILRRSSVEDVTFVSNAATSDLAAVTTPCEVRVLLKPAEDFAGRCKPLLAHLERSVAVR